MGMRRFYHPFWAVVTVVLSVIFVVLFFPLVQGKYGLLGSLLLTLAGIVLIWLNYFIRAYIFTRGDAEKSKKSNEKA